MTDDELLAIANGKPAQISDDELLKIANKPQDNDQYLLDVANGKVPAPAPPTPQQEKPGIGLSNFMDVVPGVKTVREKLLTPVAKPIEAFANEMASPLVESTSVAANIASGLPGTIASVPMQLVADTVQQAPEQLALMGAGKAVKAAGIFPKLAEFVSSKFPFLTHRGGQTEAGKAAFEAFDIGRAKGKEAATDIAKSMLTAEGGVKYTPQEQNLIAQLVEQKGQREALKAVEGKAVPANWAALAEDVPGVAGAKEVASKEFGGLPLPSATYANVAERVSGKLSELRKAMVEQGIKEEDAFARFHENYLPRIPAGDTIKTFIPNTMRAIKEKADFLRARTGKLPPQTVTTIDGETITIPGKKISLPGRSLLSDEQRASMGFRKPAEAVGLRIAQEDALINTRKLFNELNANKQIVPELGGAELVGKAGDTKLIGSDWYTKLPGEAGYGPLAGKWVRKYEADEINHMIAVPSNLGRIARNWWSAWKFGKTIASPKTHLRNFTSNAGLAHIDGGLAPWRMDIYKKAFSDMKHGKAGWAEAKNAGAPWTGRAGTQLEDVISEGALEAKPGSSIMSAFLTDLPRWAMNNKGSKFLAQGYQDSEAFFKQAVYTYRRSLGEDIPTAIAKADHAIINYDKMPIWVKRLRSMPGAVPFVSFTYGVTPIMAKAAIEKPHILNGYRILYGAWNKLAQQSIGLSPQEEKSIKDNFPGTVPLVMPWRDEDGSPMVFDVARWTPGADMVPGRVDVPLVGDIAGNIIGKSPVVQELVAQGSGRDPFTKKDFLLPPRPGAKEGLIAGGATPEDINQIFGTLQKEELTARMKHLAGSVLPPLAPGGKDFMNILEAMRGRQDFTGRVTPVAEAVVGSLTGLPRNVQQQEAMNALAIDPTITNFERVMEMRARREEARKDGMISRSLAEKQKDALATPQ